MATVRGRPPSVQVWGWAEGPPVRSGVGSGRSRVSCRWDNRVGCRWDNRIGRRRDNRVSGRWDNWISRRRNHRISRGRVGGRCHDGDGIVVTRCADDVAAAPRHKPIADEDRHDEAADNIVD